MSRIKQLSAYYLASLSGLSLEEQGVALTLVVLSDDEGRGIANPELILANSPQLAGNMASWDLAAIMDSLLGKWPMYREYRVENTTYYFILDYQRFCTSNHPAPSKLPPPPAELLAASASAVAAPARGRPRGSSGRQKQKASPTPAERWTDPHFPEKVYEGWRQIYDASLGGVLGEAEHITRNARRNIDMAISAGYDEAAFRRACAIAANSDWWCGRKGEKRTPSNFETTSAPSTIKNLLAGRYD